MGRQIVYAPKAARMIRSMDTRTRDRIQGKIRQLADDPKSMANNVKALQGMKGVFRLRVGDWRVLFTESGVVLNILAVAPRGSAYD